jgi:CheY-like chemotaxis protein
MSEANSLIENLPALRRYARAINVSAIEGDKCIERLLEGVLEGDIKLAAADSPPILGAFHELDLLLKADRADTSPLIASTIDRRALLLVTMEEFSHQDAAIILGIPTEAMPELLQVAEEKLKTSLATDVMIIEDEILIARHIGSIMEDIGHNVVAYATTQKEAITLAKEANPNLILADIKLADGSLGTDAAEDIWAMFPDMPIIFITAYPEIFLTGDKKEPDFLIPKPFRPEYVQAVVSQALIGQKIAT